MGRPEHATTDRTFFIGPLAKPPHTQRIRSAALQEDSLPAILPWLSSPSSQVSSVCDFLSPACCRWASSLPPDIEESGW